jgi:hypothetical protein
MYAFYDLLSTGLPSNDTAGEVEGGKAAGLLLTRHAILPQKGMLRIGVIIQPFGLDMQAGKW